MGTSALAAEHDDGAWPSPIRGWVLVGLLALASVVSQFDRTVINLMVEPIKAEFGLNDTAFGAAEHRLRHFLRHRLHSAGRAADYTNRKPLIGTCLFFWSLFVMSSGLAKTYWQLFLTRIAWPWARPA